MSIVQEQHSREPSRWILPAVAIGTMLAPLNSTMVAIALPGIQDSLGASVTSTAWLVTLYLVAMAVGQPVGGRLGDLYGRRRVYLIGLVGFALASAGCAFAPSLEWLIAFRTMQALTGALTFPNGAAIIRESIPEARRGVAFGIVGLAAASAAAAGPPIGGALVHAWDWSAVFWVNIPVIAIAFALGWRSLPRGRRSTRQRSRFDYAGTALFALALGCVIVIPSLLKLDLGWLGAAAALASVVLGWMFVRSQVTSSAPVIDLRLFRQSHFAAACASIFLSNLVMYTVLLSLPLFLERVRDHGVQTTGIVLAAMSAFAALLGPLGGRWADRQGHWSPAVWGASALAVGTIVLSASIAVDGLTLIVVALVVMGLGLGIGGAPVQAAALQAVSGENAGAAAGIFSTARYLGSVAGTTIMALIFAGEVSEGDSNAFAWLFAGLAVASILGIIANSRVADRHPEIPAHPKVSVSAISPSHPAPGSRTGR